MLDTAHERYIFKPWSVYLERFWTRTPVCRTHTFWKYVKTSDIQRWQCELSKEELISLRLHQLFPFHLQIVGKTMGMDGGWRRGLKPAILYQLTNVHYLQTRTQAATDRHQSPSPELGDEHKTVLLCNSSRQENIFCDTLHFDIFLFCSCPGLTISLRAVPDIFITFCKNTL